MSRRAGFSLFEVLIAFVILTLVLMALNGSTGANFPGLSFMFQGGSSAVTLNALFSVTNVNVVSSPSLLVLNNQEALLQIGDEVPIATQQVVDTANANAPVVNTISFRDTGIILKVKPRVSSSGRVVLDIEQEVSSVLKHHHIWNR